jgi:cardiolipin synthase
MCCFIVYMPLKQPVGLPSVRMPKNSTLSAVPKGRDLRKQGRSFLQRHGKIQTVLLIIGAATVLSILGSLFIAAGTSPDKLYSDREVAPVDTELFANSLSNLVNGPLERGGSVSILNNGAEFLPALIDAIDHAEKTINFSVYIWQAGVFSEEVIAALLRAQNRRVAVRVLLDDYGSIGLGSSVFTELERAGARVERFRTPQFGKWTRLHRRNHQRAIVIDGRIGFTGGMAVKDVWLGNAQDPDHWRDMMFKLTGPPARSLQAAFVSAWVSSSGELLVGPDMYPELGQPEGVERFIHLVNSPAADDYSMAEFFIMPILAARTSIHIVTPYFIPDTHLKSVLIKKAQQGVDVRMLLPGKHIDSSLPRSIAQSHYEDLLQAGVKISESRPTFIHSKFMVVDRQWSIIGPPNLNYRSRQLDEENAFGILDRQLAEQLVEVFDADLKNADAIQLENWERRSVIWRFVERFSRFFDKQD